MGRLPGMQAQRRTVQALVAANGLCWTTLFVLFYGIQRPTGRRWRGAQKAMFAPVMPRLRAA